MKTSPDEPEPASRAPLRLAAVGDLHGGGAAGLATAWRRTYDGKPSEQPRLLVLAGDVTPSGQTREAEAAAATLASIAVPKVLVLGNHEHDHGQPDEVVKAFRGAGWTVLEGEENTLELEDGTGIVGAKGFCGGFGAATLAPFGERAIKAFVDAALEEQRLLEVGLRKIAGCGRKVVVLHYAPIRETLRGEPEEIYPFLGSSRFAETIDRFGVTAVFHGHAHHGTLEGHTPGGAPVWNVALPVLQRTRDASFLVQDVGSPVAAPAA